ncbi:hypothetical protein LTS18_006587, partial [Coniosporium uncinatum]
ARLSQVLDEEKQKAASERSALLDQITSLVTANTTAQESRVSGYMTSFGQAVNAAASSHAEAEDAFNQGMDTWTERSRAVVGNLTKSRDSIKTRIKTDFADATSHATSLKQTTTSVHGTASRIVSEQMSHMDTQLHSIDEIVSRIHAQNETAHSTHVSSLSSLASTVRSSYGAVGDQFATSFSRLEALGSEMDTQAKALRDTLPELGPNAQLRQPLSELREAIDASQLQEYASTGETPARIQYDFPTTLPRTETHAQLLAKLRGDTSSIAALTNRSPSKAPIFTDALVDPSSSPSKSGSISTDRPTSASSAPITPAVGLRELDINVVAPPPAIAITTLNASSADEKSAAPVAAAQTNGDSGAEKRPAPPLFKRQNTLPEGLKESKLPMKRGGGRMTVAGVGGGGLDRENLRPGDFGASVGTAGRRLRSRGSD